MQKLFNNILIPVDFALQINGTIEKAIDIAKQYQCSIHLLHVVTTSAFSSSAISDGNMYMSKSAGENDTRAAFELERLWKLISQSSGGLIDVKWNILSGSWHDVIIASIIQNKIDLVLIGTNPYNGKKRKLALNPDKIAAEANIPVMTVPADRRLVKLRSIVIPVTDFLPFRKLLYGVYLAKEYDSTLMLLGVSNSTIAEKVMHYMDNSQKLVNSNSQLTVQTDFVDGQNVAKAVYDFAILKYADLIILNPGSQTKMPGLFSSLLGNTIQKYSIPPVLAVNTLQGL